MSKQDKKGKLILVKEDENARQERAKLVKEYKKTQFIAKHTEFAIGS